MDPLAFLALLQLSSPSLPVGGFSYSQGMEQAVEDGWVVDEASAQSWIGDLLTHSLSGMDLAFVAALHKAFDEQNLTLARALDRQYLTGRETAELRAETLQMGHSMRIWLASNTSRGHSWVADWPQLTWPTAWTVAAVCNQVPRHQAVMAFGWTWLENQVLSAIKTVPLGQTAGARLMANLRGTLVDASQAAQERADAQLFGSWMPGFAIASSRHENLYTRIFRS